MVTSHETQDLRSISTPSANLPSLPVELHRRIASYCDELDIWRMMAVCRGTRQGAQMALQPYLTRRTVTVNPPFVVDMLDEINEDFAENTLVRRKALRKRSKRFAAHLNAYPPSLDHLKSMTLEVRDDDDTAGFELLRTLAPQLESLEVHFMDRLWSLAVSDVHLEPCEDVKGEIVRQASNTSDCWRRGLDFGEVDFPRLHHLSIISPCRALDQFSAMADSLRNLRSITLCANWRDVAHYRYKPSPIYALDYDFFDHLNYITLIGDSTIFYMAKQFLNLTGNWTTLTLKFTGVRADRDDRAMRSLISEMTRHEIVRELAICGNNTGDFVRAIVEHDRREGVPNPSRLNSVHELYLEHIDDCAQEEYLEDDYPYTMLSGDWYELPILPNLRLITWINREEIDFPPQYKKSALQRLFKKYPKLTHVQWMDDNPANPYTVDSPADGHDGKVIHRVDRPRA